MSGIYLLLKIIMKNINTQLVIAVILSLFIGTVWGFVIGKHGGMKNKNHMMMQYDSGKDMKYGEDNEMKEHCEMMPNMAGCEKYSDDVFPVDHSMMDMSDMDPMSMSMADMGAMLEWKTGDELDRAFLEGMIPHHQGAIDMAEYLVDAKHPELQALGTEIIAAQQAEIDQMNAWLLEWGYTE